MSADKSLFKSLFYKLIINNQYYIVNMGAQQSTWCNPKTQIQTALYQGSTIKKQTNIKNITQSENKKYLNNKLIEVPERQSRDPTLIISGLTKASNISENISITQKTHQSKQKVLLNSVPGIGEQNQIVCDCEQMEMENQQVQMQIKPQKYKISKSSGDNQKLLMLSTNQQIILSNR